MLTWGFRAVDAPAARVPAVPRLLLEIGFLVAVAVAAAIAELEAIEIVGVMTAAWLLVAIAELVAARAARRRTEMVYAPLPELPRATRPTRPGSHRRSSVPFSASPRSEKRPSRDRRRRATTHRLRSRCSSPPPPSRSSS